MARGAKRKFAPRATATETATAATGLAKSLTARRLVPSCGRVHIVAELACDSLSGACGDVPSLRPTILVSPRVRVAPNLLASQCRGVLLLDA